MTLELKPLGNLCNLACGYCYQEPMRLAGNIRASHKYDLDLMMDKAEASGKAERGYTLFGGEPLLLPLEDLEKVFERSFRKYNQSFIQTNGTLITDAHIQLFKKYNVGVGISIDGPNDLNSLRLPTNKRQDVDKLTAASMESIRKLAAEDIGIGIIITLHKKNGTKEQLPRLIQFIQWLEQIGHTEGNIHMLEVDSPLAASYSLTTEENTEAFLTLAKFFEENPQLHYQPFREMKAMMSSDDSKINCIWSSCDPMNTKAVYGIEGNGQLSNCGMVNKEGIEWTKAKDIVPMRDPILYQIPDEYGGCKGCPFFLLCNGYCPGSAQDNDWRNKTVHCKTLKSMFGFYEGVVEEEGKVPFSKREDREAMEHIQVDRMLNGYREIGIKDLEKLLPSAYNQ